MSELGAEIHVLNFSRSKDADDTISNEIVGEEFKKSMDVLGATYEMLDLPTRRLPEYRQVILDYLYGLNQRVGFDLIFCHSSYDQHL